MNRTDQRTVLEAFSREFRREMHNIQERPDTIWQQMYNMLQWADGPDKDGPVTKVIAPEFDERTAPKARALVPSKQQAPRVRSIDPDPHRPYRRSHEMPDEIR
jgi:hypothetical protein